VKGTVLIDQPQDAVDQRLPLVVAKLPERGGPTQVFVVVRIATGTPQRTFTSDLDGE
jgi:hypothetical protein